LLGGGYRLDHDPLLIAMDKGDGGHYLHGGAVERQDFSQTYAFKFGKMFCGLTVVEFQLADEGPGDGGLAAIPGSHKANFPLPEKLSFYEVQREYVKEVHTQAGDAIIFTEALRDACVAGGTPAPHADLQIQPWFSGACRRLPSGARSGLSARHDRRRARHARVVDTGDEHFRKYYDWLLPVDAVVSLLIGIRYDRGHGRRPGRRPDRAGR
jgi:hypothetical protein